MRKSLPLKLRIGYLFCQYSVEMPDNPAVEDPVGLKRTNSIVKTAATSDISGIIDVLIRAFSKDL